MAPENITPKSALDPTLEKQNNAWDQLPQKAQDAYAEKKAVQDDLEKKKISLETPKELVDDAINKVQRAKETDKKTLSPQEVKDLENALKQFKILREKLKAKEEEYKHARKDQQPGIEKEILDLEDQIRAAEKNEINSKNSEKISELRDKLKAKEEEYKHARKDQQPGIEKKYLT